MTLKLERLNVSPTRGEVLLRLPYSSCPSKVKYPENRPSWWDMAHRKLKELEEINQTRPLSQAEIYVITVLATNIKEHEDPITQLAFLKLLSEFIFIETKDIFFHVLLSLQAKYPEIQHYFQNKPIYKPREIVFTPEAIQLILNQVCPIPTFAISAFDLPPLIESIMDHMPDSFIQGWVTYDPEAPDHFIPVFAHKQKGITNIFVFDSLGHSIDKNSSSIDAIDAIIDHFKKKADRFKEFAVYSYKDPRLNDLVGCSVMAINDLKHLAERHLSGQNLIDFYESQDEENKPKPIAKQIVPKSDMAIYELSILPPEMQKIVQSRTEIIKYEKYPPIDPESPIVNRLTSDWTVIEKKQDLGELKNSAEKSKRYDRKDHARNLYLEQKRLQYMIELLTYHFKFLSPTSNALKVEKAAKRRMETAPEDENPAKRDKT